MEGSGQGLILRSLAGIIRPSGGKIMLQDGSAKGRNLVGKHYFDFKNSGITFLPASRVEEGLIPGLTLTEHFVLAEKQKGFFINRGESEDLTEKRIKDFNIKGTKVSKVESLSGGNQQRMLLALMRDPLKLLLLEHPTRGLDIESSMDIWSKLKTRCKDGASILFISSDLDEVLQYSDRIIVFFGGRVSKPYDAAKITIDQLGQLIGGKGWA
jgi:simple sugar transport system ATP-binding protein